MTSNPKTVDEYLNECSYGDDDKYVPSEFALKFVNFIKLVNGAEGESNKTPVLHYKMLDKAVANSGKDLINLVHRGAAKLQSGSSKVLTPTGWVTMRDLQQGQQVINRYGQPTTVVHKTAPKYPRMFKMTLSDGTVLEVGDEHNHIVVWKKKVNGKAVVSEKVFTTLEMIDYGLTFTGATRKTSKDPKAQYRFRIPLTDPIQFSTKQLPMDPYVIGLMIANGNYKGGSLSCHTDDLQELLGYVNPIGSVQSYGNASRMYVGKDMLNWLGDITSRNKSIPEICLLGDVHQRTQLLRGLMDGDGTISKNGSSRYSTYSEALAKDVVSLVQSLGGIATVSSYTKANGGVEYAVRVQLKINPFRLERKASKWKPSVKLTRPIVSIEEFECKEEGYCIKVASPCESYITEGYTVTHNTTLLGEYLFLYLAVFGELDGFGEVPFAIYVSDSIDNGVKNMRKNLEFRRQNSEFLMEWIPEAKFNDITWEFTNKVGNKFIVKGYGGKALSLDTQLFTKNGTTTIGAVQVGDRIFGNDGKLATVTKKSEIFHKPMYEIQVEDGRTLKVSEDHLNPVVIKFNPNNKAKYEERILTTLELIDEPLQHIRNRKRNNKPDYVSKENLIFINNPQALEYEEASLPIDPYTLGVILGDGRIRKDCGSVELTAHIDEFNHYYDNIPYEFGAYNKDSRSNAATQSIRGLGKQLKLMGLNVRGEFKFIPNEYFYGSFDQRLALIQGLMDTDGTVDVRGRTTFTSNSYQLCDDLSMLVRSVGGSAKFSKCGSSKAYRIELWMQNNCFRLLRKKDRFKPRTKLMAVTGIRPIELEPSQCIAIDNESHQFIADAYFPTHNTGVRGAKALGKRPVLAVLDDLISDEDARSPTVIAGIEDTIYKAIDYALDPTKRKVIWSGTPFNAKDPLYKAVESGAWEVNVYPVCETFPCTRAEFRGSWEDRFSYDYVKAQYDKAKASGKLDTFNQELMLRIMSEDDKIIFENEIQWYSRRDLITRRNQYNFYITTDFATSEKTSADFSVISVWAINNKGHWFYVDGICRRQLMDKNVDDLFRLVQEYAPQEVGIEVTGQQGGFIPWLQSEMMKRNIFFNLSSGTNGGQAGIRPTSQKFTRFLTVVPWFKQRIMFFPREMENEPPLIEGLNELRLASRSGLKSKHDDFLDTISMLSLLNVWKPSEEISLVYNEHDDIWAPDTSSDSVGGYDSYVV